MGFEEVRLVKKIDGWREALGNAGYDLTQINGLNCNLRALLNSELSFNDSLTILADHGVRAGVEMGPYITFASVMQEWVNATSAVNNWRSLFNSHEQKIEREARQQEAEKALFPAYIRLLNELGLMKDSYEQFQIKCFEYEIAKKQAMIEELRKGSDERVEALASPASDSVVYMNQLVNDPNFCTTILRDVVSTKAVVAADKAKAAADNDARAAAVAASAASAASVTAVAAASAAAALNSDFKHEPNPISEFAKVRRAELIQVDNDARTAAADAASAAASIAASAAREARQAAARVAARAVREATDTERPSLTKAAADNNARAAAVAASVASAASATAIRAADDLKRACGSEDILICTYFKTDLARLIQNDKSARAAAASAGAAAAAASTAASLAGEVHRAAANAASEATFYRI